MLNIIEIAIYSYQLYDCSFRIHILHEFDVNVRIFAYKGLSSNRFCCIDTLEWTSIIFSYIRTYRMHLFYVALYSYFRFDLC